MTQRNHLVFSTTLTLPSVFIVNNITGTFSLNDIANIKYLLIGLVIMFFSTLLPDIDHAKSKINQYLPSFISSIIIDKWTHRGPTHKPLFLISYMALVYGVIIYFKLYEYQELILVTAFVGYVSHLLGDAMTTYGIPNFIGRYHLWILPYHLR